MTHIRGNFLLNRLPPDVLSSIEPCLATVELPLGEVLVETADRESVFSAFRHHLLHGRAC
jgi:hypothetical protein